jgi:hypothetical protein
MKTAAMTTDSTAEIPDHEVQLAEERGLVAATIESHPAHCVRAWPVKRAEIVGEEKNCDYQRHG